MQLHVAGLDTAGCKRAQRGEILGKPNCSHELREFDGGARTGHCESQRRTRVAFQRTADRGNLEGQCNFSEQVSVIGSGPTRQRPVPARNGCISVHPGFDRAPIVPRSDGHGIDTIHDAFVMGSCPIGIHKCNVVCSNDRVTNVSG